jgi:hypothetical protein
VGIIASVGLYVADVSGGKGVDFVVAMVVGCVFVWFAFVVVVVLYFR